jgi:hypothetical protein
MGTLFKIIRSRKTRLCIWCFASAVVLSKFHSPLINLLFFEADVRIDLSCNSELCGRRVPELHEWSTNLPFGSCWISRDERPKLERWTATNPPVMISNCPWG